MNFLTLTQAQQAILRISEVSGNAMRQLADAAKTTFAALWYSGQSPMKWQEPTHTPEELAAMPQEDQDAIAAAAAGREEAMAAFKVAAAERLAALGANAGLAFAQHARTIQFLLASGVDIPAPYYTPPFAFTLANDGTITLDP